MSKDPTISPAGDVEIITSGICLTCPLCKHAICDKLTEIYYENEKDIVKTLAWFDDKFVGRKFDDDTFTKHFKEHIDPFVTEIAIIKKRKLQELKQKTLASKKENSMRFGLIKQITWELMQDVYINRKELLKDEKDKASHQKMSKEFTELAKTYREYYSMELEIIGMGKSEEDQKAIMEGYVAGMLKQAAIALEDIPGATEKLADFMDLNLSDKKGDKRKDIKKDVIIEEEDDGF